MLSSVQPFVCFINCVSGLIPLVVENVLDGDELTTDVESIERQIGEVSAENVVCVISTTSVFAPRAPDRWN